MTTPDGHDELLQVEIEDRIAIVTLNRPEQLNAWSDGMGREISRALRACDAEPEVRAVVLTGAGRAFCAGADLSGGRDRFKEPEQTSPDDFHPWDVRKPVVAAINGHAIGVGMSLAMSCDLRFVSERAKLAFAFPRRGVLPGFASHATLARAIGMSGAADLLLSGRTISGVEAAELGIASSAHPAEAVLGVALDWARDAATHAAPLPQAISKRLLWEPLAPGALKAREDRLFAWLGTQPDAAEGVQAFLDKRDPHWTGDLDTLPALDDE